MSEYRFTATQDWFSGHIGAWRTLFQYVQSPTPRVLEVGSWEGRSAVFLLNELCEAGGDLTAIDHFDLMQTPDGRARADKLRHNLSLTGKPFRIIEEFSVPGLMKLLDEEMSARNAGFDWIYIDGSHRADDTLLDAELVWRLARNNAVIVFDDCHWPKEAEGGMEHPRRGIDAFLQLHEGEFERLSVPEDYQLAVRKLTPMRIGFLTAEAAEQTGSYDDMAESFEYGINLALAFDDEYAMAASVAMCSALEHIRGRCTVYIYDCGLSRSVKEKLQQSIEDSQKRKVTYNFIYQRDGDLSLGLGPVWAKLDLLKRLPVERVLYLDADVLVRGDLGTLWATDLGGKSMGAVRDAGFPNGHDGIGEAGYFNAGVLLIDLARARSHLDDLWSTARNMTQSMFKDQDCLNVHFKDEWAVLGVRYNAQGQGTYAKNEHQCEDPVVVHFTGPVSPSIGIVLNPWVQPYTSKPWGYAGAPGHPHCIAWWSALESTAWKGWRDTAECKARRDLEKGKIIRQGLEKLDCILAGGYGN